jgi:DNA adenine methylase
VRDAAHKFMEEFQNLGLMHRELVNGSVKILESYVAPAEFEVDSTKVKKGTWLLAVRVTDDALWQKVKAGELTGFSIGGSARRNPE